MRVISVLPVFLVLCNSVFAQTNVSGYILSNTTWTLANSPYIVTGNILVNNGVTLTIEPGVTVKFDTTKSLQIDGELLAIGTTQSRITFTASDSTPVAGSWGRLQFSPNSTDAVFDTAGNYVSGSILKYCDIRYGGGVPGDVTVYCDTAAPYFSNCRIADCLKNAVYFVRAVGRVDSSSIKNCGGTAVSYVNPVSAALTIENDTIENNGAGISRSVSNFANVIIQNCLFTSTGNAIAVSSSSNTIIKNNIFTSTGNAITVSISSNTFIKNNKFTANVNVLMGNLGNTTISDNKFIGNTNSVIGGTGCCTDIDGFDYVCHNFQATNLAITNNYFGNNKGAIYAYANYSIIQGDTFQNNQFNTVFNSCGYPAGNSYKYRFIELLHGGGIITNNVFDGNTTASTPRIFVKVNGSWEIANNVFKNNSPGGISCNGKPTICSNKFLNNSGSAIASSGSSAGPFIHHNEFSNNSDGGTIISTTNSSTIRDNEFTNNSVSVVSVTTGSTINNNQFQDNSSTTSSLVSISGSASTFTNNRFLNSLNLGYPIISVSNSNSNIHNNDILNNNGLVSLRISGTAQPVITQNNFVNPNVQFEIENLIPFGPGANIDLSNNYWGTTDTAHIDSVIKDYFDDANLSVALYPPVLTAPAFVDTNASCTSVVCSLSVSGTTVNPSCYGGSNGSINITVSNGTSPYNYFWSSGATTEDISNRASGSYTVTVIDANLCSATKSFSLGQPASPVSVVSGAVTNATCNTGGTITIAAGGGTSPYTYNWGSGIITQNRTGLNPGNYSVTVEDNNNCTAAQSFTVGQDAGPAISGVVSNTSCNAGCDGAINLSVAGIPPFTYDWGTGFGTSEDTSLLCAGTYSVTVADSNNCGIAASFIITSPVALSATASVTTGVSCFGYSDGAATAAAIGGTPPYSFLWSGGQTAATATGLSAGAYDVTVTDSLGCAAAASVTVADGYNVFVGVIGGPSSSSINQSETYIVSANFNYSYAWSVLNGIILTGQGTNSIEVAWTAAGNGLVEVIASEQGCADTVSKTVTVIDTTRNCSALFYLYPDTVPHSYFVVNTASGIPQLSYSWNWGDGSAPDTAAYPSHTYSAAGFYTICLTITDSAGCTDTYCNPYFLLKAEDESSAMIQVNVYPPTFTGIPDAALEGVVLYPNPTDGMLTLKAAGIFSKVTLNLRDALGKQISHASFTGKELGSGIRLDLSNYNCGIFFLEIHTESGNRVMKVVKY